MSEPEGGERVPVPVAHFIKDVEEHLAGRDPEVAIKELNNNYSIYKTVEQDLMQRKARLMTKVPDLKKALEMVKLLISKQGNEVTVDYQLSEQVYAAAKMKDVETVMLWLGADIMLEYPLQEALELLEQNLENAKQNLDTNNKSLELIKDYVTTTEVSMARIYNFDVSRKRGKELEGKPI